VVRVRAIKDGVGNRCCYWRNDEPNVNWQWVWLLLFEIMPASTCVKVTTSCDYHLRCCRYVLLHHVMGGVSGVPGAWAYVQGGMGQVSASIARSAMSHGACIITDAVRNDCLLLLECLSDGYRVM
jgi:hypothetical protein